MAGHFQEMHLSLQVSAASTTPIRSTNIGGIFCVTAGTFQINGTDDQGNPVVIVPTFTGIAGTFHKLPFWIGRDGGTIVSGAGATGVLAV